MPLTKTQGGLIAAVVLTVVIVTVVALALNWDAVLCSAKAPMEAVRAAVQRLEVKPRGGRAAAQFGSSSSEEPVLQAVAPHERGSTVIVAEPVRDLVTLERPPGLSAFATRTERTETQITAEPIAQGVIASSGVTTEGAPTAGQFVPDFVIGTTTVPPQLF